MNPNNPPSAKLIQFNQELEALCKKYLYQLQCVLKYNVEGISAEIQAVDVTPPVETPPAEATPVIDTKTTEEKASA